MSNIPKMGHLPTPVLSKHLKTRGPPWNSRECHLHVASNDQSMLCVVLCPAASVLAWPEPKPGPSQRRTWPSHGHVTDWQLGRPGLQVIEAPQPLGPGDFWPGAFQSHRAHWVCEKATCGFFSMAPSFGQNPRFQAFQKYCSRLQGDLTPSSSCWLCGLPLTLEPHWIGVPHWWINRGMPDICADILENWSKSSQLDLCARFFCLLSGNLT